MALLHQIEAIFQLIVQYGVLLLECAGVAVLLITAVKSIIGYAKRKPHIRLSLAQGISLVTESVWSSRYRYVDELRRMGASIQVDDKTAVVEGVDHLVGAPIQASDLRAGAALVIAALAAKGQSEISCVHYIERGYENLVEKLRGLGANIRAVEESEEHRRLNLG